MTICIALAAAALGQQSCKDLREEAEKPWQATITASIESDAETRTSLSSSWNGVSSVFWSEGDQIAVYIDGSTNYRPFTLSKGAGTKNAFFTGDGVGSSYVALYPLSMNPSLSGKNLNVTFPYEQAYIPDSFVPGAFPMAAVSGSSDIHFRNVCSVLRLSLTGHNRVTRIVFRSKDPAALVCGKAVINLDNADAPVLKVVDNGRDSLALNVSDVTLKKDAATDFFLVLPAQTYKGGFTVRIYSDNRYMEKVYTADFTMERSRLHKAGAFEFTPNGVDESTFLSGSGTKADPFLIQSLSDLVLLRDSVNGNKAILSENGAVVNASTAYYLLTCDIDLSPVCGADKKWNWKPIGSDTAPFSGMFDGGYHKVENLYINGDYPLSGLLGMVDNGTVTSLSVSGSVLGVYISGLVAGRVKGEISNCTSSGKVISEYGSIIGGIAGEMEGSLSCCVNYAEVRANGYAGGIAGNLYGNGAFDCINKGAVTGNNNIGGIAGNCSGTCSDCTNYGAVTCKSTVGGISGYHNHGSIINSVNEGKVDGSEMAGGIVGYLHQSVLVANCANHAPVSGSGEYIGGICGLAGSEFSYNGPSSIRNCVNTSDVACSGTATSVGGICGGSEGATNFNGDTFKASETEQNYWLYDAARGLGIKAGIGKDEGKSANNFVLSVDEMKGTPSGRTFYKTYSSVTDALSAWAFDNSGSTRYQGWKASPSSGYPALTGMDASLPGTPAKAFELSKSSFDVMAVGERIEIEVKSIESYSISVPGWITEGPVQAIEAKPLCKVHSFYVAYNDSETSRKGEIVFVNSSGTAVRAVVTQSGTYLKVDATDLVLESSGRPRSVPVSSSLEWKASSSEVWCVVSPSAGKGDGSVTLKAAANESDKTRSAVVTVASADGKYVCKVNVVQSGSHQEGQQIDWTGYKFIHKSLTMLFTSTYDGWSGKMELAIRKAMELYPGKMTYVAIHESGSELAFSQSNAMWNQYWYNTYPYGLIDCRMGFGSEDPAETSAGYIVNTIKETESTYGTLTGVAVNSTVTGNMVDAQVDVYVKKAGDYKITVLLLEDGIKCRQSDYENGNQERYVHNCVARGAMSSIRGDEFVTDKDNTVRTFNYSSSVPSSCDLSNMHILVYVQRKFAPQPAIQSFEYGNFFVDNSADVKAGEILKLALEGGTETGGGGTGSGGNNEGITTGGDINIK